MTLFISVILLITASVCADDFEEYRTRQQKEAEVFYSENLEQMKEMQNDIQSAFSAWKAEQEKYKDNATVNYTAFSPDENSAVKEKIDYKKSSAEIEAVSTDTDSLEAIKKARRNAGRSIEGLITKEITRSGIPPDSVAMKKLIKNNLDKIRVRVKKNDKGYSAKASYSPEFKGKNSLVSLVREEKKKIPNTKKKENQEYTSVIIDAREAGYTSCLLPVVTTAKGEKLYGPGFTDKKFAINGMARWERSPAEAVKNPAAGKSPLPVLASALGDGNSVIVEGEKANILRKLGGSSVLRECRVIFIVK